LQVSGSTSCWRGDTVLGIDTIIPRRALAVLEASMASFRGVIIQGARQVGKSTIAQQLADELGTEVVSLDREEDLAAARDDPRLLLDTVGTPAVIDEIQRAGEPMLLALKQRFDASRRKGQFVLTGSSNFLTTPALSESLAGRVDLVTLWPLSMGELLGGNDDFVDRAFGSGSLIEHRTPASLERTDYLDLICRGGYPEAHDLAPAARQRWFDRYLETVLRREVETATDLRKFDALASLARLLIVSTGEEFVASRIAENVGLDRSTVDSYEPWIESTFLVHRVPAWRRKPSGRVVRRPKLHVCDTGLAAGLTGRDAAALARRHEPLVGPLVESFVIAELAKQLTWSTISARLSHFRDRDGLEIDAVIEANDGRVLAVEIKASTIARSDDAQHLARFRDRLDAIGSDFVSGIVFHTGDRRSRLGDRLYGLPISDLWT
jgi:predicted AAA+ superfamily ATPase